MSTSSFPGGNITDDFADVEKVSAEFQRVCKQAKGMESQDKFIKEMKFFINQVVLAL